MDKDQLEATKLRQEGVLKALHEIEANLDKVIATINLNLQKTKKDLTGIDKKDPIRLHCIACGSYWERRIMPVRAKLCPFCNYDGVEEIEECPEVKKDETKIQLIW